MPVGITTEHRALADSVGGWATRAGVSAEARRRADASLEGAPATDLPGFWKALADQGFLVIHLAEEIGGGGGSLADAAVVVEALGRVVAPGPALATIVATHLLGRYADTAAVCLGASTVSLVGDRLVGQASTVLGDPAGLVVLPADLDGTRTWVAVPAAGSEVVGGLDPTRPVANVSVDVLLGDAVVLDAGDEDVRRVAGVLLAAESAGIAAWCLDTAVAYAKVREQFGQPIGGFQAVKHRCADMLVDVELAQASVWDAVTSMDPLGATVATAVALDAAVACAKSLVQVLGGIGYTWEHDAHLYLKRALANRLLAGGTAALHEQASRLALAGPRSRRALELPAGAERYRAEVRDLVARIAGLDPAGQRQVMADEGYLVAHWPRPYGRGADAVEQLVVAEELAAAGIARPDLVIGNWALPPILQAGTDEQRERFVRPTLLGTVTWCQMFSEPGAGSDLASLQTKASRVDGGWSLTGQKVWTSMARTATWAICLARTGTGARPHDGITYFLLDMSTPGIDVRPLRELTGEALFNEIFLTDVFVPDDCVVGEVGQGWRLARTTLANERVSMSSGAAFPSGIGELLDAVRRSGSADDPGVLQRVGELVCLAEADAALGVRSTLAQVSGTDPGAASSVRKLVGMHLRQDASEMVLDLLGVGALSGEDEAVRRFLSHRALTIAGGTSEVLHNVVGERVLGLPR